MAPTSTAPAAAPAFDACDDLHRCIAHSLSLEPSRPALETGGTWHSRAEVRELAERLDAQLLSAGVARGASVAVVTRNRTGHVATVLGLLATQRCVLVVAGGRPPAKLAADIVALRPAALVADAEDWSDAVVDAARSAGSAGVTLCHQHGTLMGTVAGLERSDESAHHQADPGIAIDMQTSGTTGPPKRVPISASKVMLAIDNTLRLRSGEGSANARPPQINYYPIGHLSGFHYLLLAWCGQRPLVLLERFDLAALREAVRRHRPDVLAMPPAVLSMVLDAGVPPEELASVEIVRTGTAPLDPGLQRRFEATYGMPVLVSYGATEFWVVLTTWTLADHRRFAAEKRSSVGRAAPHVRLRVVDPATGCRLVAAQDGLLEALIDGADEAWTRTTDFACIDADGFVFLRGRADDAINRGGFKVSASKVAEVLKQCPGVLDAAVVGIDDSRLGQVPVAAVEAAEPAPTAEAIERFARALLAPYEVPARILVLRALPRTAALKVATADVRALFA